METGKGIIYVRKRWDGTGSEERERERWGECVDMVDEVEGDGGRRRRESGRFRGGEREESVDTFCIC